MALHLSVVFWPSVTMTSPLLSLSTMSGGTGERNGKQNKRASRSSIDQLMKRAVSAVMRISPILSASPRAFVRQDESRESRARIARAFFSAFASPGGVIRSNGGERGAKRANYACTGAFVIARGW